MEKVHENLCRSELQGRRRRHAKQPGKKTPSKTPKAQSGGSSRKKAMRRFHQLKQKSSDGSQSDQFLKRKFDALDGEHQNSRSKILKSFSFGGDTMAGATVACDSTASVRGSCHEKIQLI
ncbi:hypothetical protein ACJJTC_010891 [Scirpophaga incertulas]